VAIRGTFLLRRGIGHAEETVKLNTLIFCNIAMTLFQSLLVLAAPDPA
jgi:hypothetical protein